MHTGGWPALAAKFIIVIIIKQENSEWHIIKD